MQQRHSRKLNGNSRRKGVYLLVLLRSLRGSRRLLRRHSLLPWFAGLLIAMHFGVAPEAAAESYDPWPGLAQDIFNSRAMNDGAGVIAIEMPVRAEDAAIRPGHTCARRCHPAIPGAWWRIYAGDRTRIPAPMAARFELGPRRIGVGNFHARARQ